MALDWWPDVTRWQSLDILVSSLSLLACYALLPRKPPTRAMTTTCTTTDSATSTDSQTPHHSYILPSYIHHARMLPKDSTHVFKYPTLYFTFSLTALESGSCNLGWNSRLFHWNGSSSQRRKAITALEAKDYLSSDEDQPSWIAKLQAGLEHRGYLAEGQQLENDFETWVVTMPNFIGLHGINPLTVYYIYRRDSKGHRLGLWLCLLEVHNTFSERHLYLLPAGVGEDRVAAGGDSTPDSEKEWENLANANDCPTGDGLSWIVSSRRQGYDHQWTFPRSFHVSPFNDRSGYYRLYLKDLFQKGSALPTMDIRLLLLTPTAEQPSLEDTEFPQLEKKLLATLSSHSHDSIQCPRPLTSANLVKALIKQPFDLTLTFARIAYQAAKLHYGKRLDVFGKPDLSVAKGQGGGVRQKQKESATGVTSAFDGIGWPRSKNATQIELQQPMQSAEAEDTPLSRNGSLYWSAPSSAQAYFREWFLEMAQQSPRISIRLVYSNGQEDSVASQSARNDEKNSDPTLVIYLLSHAFYSDLALYGSPSLAFLMGSRVSRRWGISSLTLWQDFFKELPKDGSDPNTHTQWNRSLRARHFNWARTFVDGGVEFGAELSSDTLERVRLPSRRTETWTFYTHLASIHYAAVLEHSVFKWVRAKYVQGDEPWLEWKRGVDLVHSEEECRDDAH